MNKVSVEYRNKDAINVLSNYASDPVEAVVTVYSWSINAEGEKDIIEKSYHLYVGDIIELDTIRDKNIISEEEIRKLEEKEIKKLAKTETGLVAPQPGDGVFEDSQKMLNRIYMMLAKLDSLGYEVPDVLRKNQTR